jgi:hypothetical protein
MGAKGGRPPSDDDFVGGEIRVVGTAVRIFEALLTRTGESVVLKEFLPVLQDLADSELE